MGATRFFDFLITEEPFIKERLNTKSLQHQYIFIINKESDSESLFIDMTPLIHDAFITMTAEEKNEDFGDNITNILIHQLKVLLQMIKPELLFLSFDGIPVESKIVPHLNSRTRKVNNVSHDPKVVDSSEFTPGSEVMDDICKKMDTKSEILKSCVDHHLDVIISNVYEDGEAGLKIIKFIKTHLLQRKKKGIAIFSKNSDVPFLCLGIRAKDIFTFYYDWEVRSHISKELVFPNSYKKYDIEKLREYILKYMIEIFEDKEKSKSYKKLYDFMLMVMLMGNNYLPKHSSFKMLRDMLDCYKENPEKYLTEFNKIDENYLDKILQYAARKQLVHSQYKGCLDWNQWMKEIAGSLSLEDYALRYMKGVLCSWELIMTGDTDWPWAYQVDRPPAISMVTGPLRKTNWRRQESEYPPLPKLLPLELYAIDRPKDRVEFLSRKYRGFRERDDIQNIYEKAVDVNNKAWKLSRQLFDGDKVISEIIHLRDPEDVLKARKEKYPLFKPGHKDSFLFEILEPATSEDRDKRDGRESYRFKSKQYTQEMWDEQHGDGKASTLNPHLDNKAVNPDSACYPAETTLLLIFPDDLIINIFSRFLIKDAMRSGVYVRKLTPARATCLVVALPMEAKIEIECIAAL